MQYEYYGYLTFDPLTSREVERLLQIAQESGFEVDAGPEYLEVSYSGRDSSRKTVKFLERIAQIIGNADGEVRCEIYDDSVDPYLEFFTITGGRLFRQEGRIVRDPVRNEVRS
jgi:hypothetical protein